MGKDVASQSPRVFSVTDKDTLFLEENSDDIDVDPMKRQETLELVKAYYKIPNRKAAKILYDLIIAMSKSASNQKADE